MPPDAPPQGINPLVWAAIVLVVTNLIAMAGWLGREISMRGDRQDKAKVDERAAHSQSMLAQTQAFSQSALSQTQAESAHTQLEYDAIKNLISVQSNDGILLRGECQNLRIECEKLREANTVLVDKIIEGFALKQQLLSENIELKKQIVTLEKRIADAEFHIARLESKS